MNYLINDTKVFIIHLEKNEMSTSHHIKNINYKNTTIPDVQKE